MTDLLFFIIINRYLYSELRINFHIYDVIIINSRVMFSN